VHLTWHIGDVISKARKDQGWKQKDLADRCGLAAATIQKIEEGKDVKTSTIQAVAQAFGVTMAQLYTWIPPVIDTADYPLPATRQTKPASTIKEKVG
jgi:transcriptional regulator with XRE-family HTH domain